MPKAIDLTDQKIGKLLVLSRSESDKHGKTRWLCQCDCGSPPKVIDGGSLRKGAVLSCGCARVESNKTRDIQTDGTKRRKFKTDLVGQNFGGLTVLNRKVGPSQRGTWTCKCSCGAITDVLEYSLTSGHTKTCGCRSSYKLAGERFGKLVAVEETGKKNGKSVWLCNCDCGAQTEVLRNNLVSGITKSCGCLRKEASTERATKHGHTTHTDRSSEYESWQGMKNRCKNPSHMSWPRYGGRGIKVCPQWVDSFETFLKDMGPKPTEEHSIDRIDNDGNYEPGNCRWATSEEQHFNRADTVLVTARGKTMNVREWAEETGLNERTIRTRIRKGWDHERAVSTPAEGNRGRLITANGKTQNVSEWAKELGMSQTALSDRLNSPDWTEEQAVTTPKLTRYTK